MSLAISWLAKRAEASYKTCQDVSPSCPVEATTLGYYPNEGANIFFVVGFALSAIVAIVLGVWKRTWSFSSTLAAGCILEAAGYVGRVLLHSNPWNDDGFKLQIVAIILSPTLLCVSIYLTLKHLCLAFNPGLSRIPPRLYPFLFVPGDVSCLIIQAIGGGIAAAADDKNASLINNGNRTIIAGIVLQVIVLFLFGIMGGEYVFRLRKWIHSGNATTDALDFWANPSFKRFLYAVSGAYIAILIRCVYRIVEMAGGWGNGIMQDEPSFIVLESVMVLIGSALLAAFNPSVLLRHPASLQNKSKEEMSQFEHSSGIVASDSA